MDIKRETTFKDQKIEGRKRKTKKHKSPSNEEKKYTHIYIYRKKGGNKPDSYFIHPEFA